MVSPFPSTFFHSHVYLGFFFLLFGVFFNDFWDDLSDPKMFRRKNRVASCKAYSVEGNVKRVFEEELSLG